MSLKIGLRGTDVQVNYPAFYREEMPSGAIRWRVRVEGKKAVRVRLNVSPDHPTFREHYYAARAGIQLPLPRTPKHLRLPVR